jgi:hypothetical protein
MTHVGQKGTTGGNSSQRGQREDQGPPHPSARLPCVCLGGHTVGVCLGRLFFSQAYSQQVVAVSLPTQRVRNDDCLSWVIVNFQLIVLDQLEPSLLPHVQIRLGKDRLQAFVVRIDMNHIPMQIVMTHP